MPKSTILSRYLTIIATSLSLLLTPQNQQAVTAEVAPIFQPYLQQIQSQLPPQWQIRLPSKLDLDSLLKSSKITVVPLTSTQGLVVNLFSCDSEEVSCKIGYVSVESLDSPDAQAAFTKHQKTTNSITLNPQVTAYLLEGKKQNPPSDFSSVMWQQDGVFYTIQFKNTDSKSRQDLLYIAYSMVNNEPINANTDLSQYSSNQISSGTINTPETETTNVLSSASIRRDQLQFEFKGNTAFSDAELQDIVKKTFGEQETINFADLMKLETAIKDQYIKGCQDEYKSDLDIPCYVNSGVIIDPQASNNTITVNIIEGEIQEIQVTGTKRLHPSYIRDRLALVTEKPFNQKALLQGLQLLQLNPLIKKITAEVVPGVNPDQSILIVNVSEADNFDVNLSVDNGSVPNIGTITEEIGLTESNLFGLGDAFNISYTHTEGSHVVDTSYNIPVNARNTTINLAGEISWTNVIEEPFDRLDIKGNSWFIQGGINHPLILTPRQELGLGLNFSHQQNQTSLLGMNFPLSIGADENGETNVSKIAFSQNYVTRSANDIFIINSSLNFGVDILNATVNVFEDTPDGSFFSWQTQTQYVRNLGNNTLLLLRGDLQLTPESLLPLEKFTIGGLNSVRGYRQDTLVTDNGFFVSAEVRLPIFKVTKWQGVFKIVPFFDIGSGWNNSSLVELDQNLLMSIGLGLQWEMGDTLNMRVDWGYPLTDINYEKNNLQEQGVTFSVETSF